MHVLGGWPGCPLVLVTQPINVGDSHPCMDSYDILCSEGGTPGFHLRYKERLLVLDCSSERNALIGKGARGERES